MAKISAELREKNKKKYDQVILEMFLAEGWDSITLNTVSAKLDIRKSTVQGYYPAKSNFAEALSGKVFPRAMKELDFQSPEQFIESWKNSLIESKMFKMVIHMLVSNATRSDTSAMTLVGLGRLKQLLTNKFGEKNADNIMCHVLGLSVIKLAGDTVNLSEIDD